MLTGRKIAHVDDSPEFAVLVDYRLANAEVRYFREVSLFVDEGFDLILLDLRLAETFGAHSIRAMRERTKAPIAVLTGLGGAQLTGTDRFAFMDAGACEVYDKEIVNNPEWPMLVHELIEKNELQSVERHLP